jgi:acetate kinase
LLGGLLEWVYARLGADTLIAIRHRVVHGGSEFTGPILLNVTSSAHWKP